MVHGSLQMQDPKNRHLGTIAQLCRAISSQLRHILTIRKKLTKQQYLPTSPQYGELRPTSGCDWLVSLGHPYEFQRVSRLGSVTAQYSSSGRQPNFAALNRGRHLAGKAAITLGIGPHSRFTLKSGRVAGAGASRGRRRRS